MNKIQYIELAKLRGITELDNTSLAEAIRMSGGEPTEKEMVQVNKNAMNYYIDQYTEQQKIVSKLNKKIEGLQKRSDFLSRLEAAGVDNWDGYEFAFEDEIR